jgi:hypothetical protein
MMAEIGLGKKQDSFSKTTRAKRAGSTDQAAECLPSKHEALSSNSHTSKKKNKKKVYILS